MLAVKATNRMLYATRGVTLNKLQPSVRHLNTNASFFERWFTVPKGFKKFFPKDGKGPGSSSTTEAGAKKAKDKGSASKYNINILTYKYILCNISLLDICVLYN